MKIKTGGTQKEQEIMETKAEPKPLLHYDLDFDTMEPEEKLKSFVKDIRAMIARYEGNKDRIAEIENELNDIEHYMEIGNFKNVPEGYRLYRKLAELRRERRACKNENDLLWPVYQHFHATEVLNKLTMVQGECAKLNDSIVRRSYQVRTDILDSWLNPEKNNEVNVTLPDLPEKKPELFKLVWTNKDGNAATG